MGNYYISWVPLLRRWKSTRSSSPGKYCWSNQSEISRNNWEFDLQLEFNSIGMSHNAGQRLLSICTHIDKSCVLPYQSAGGPTGESDNWIITINSRVFALDTLCLHSIQWSGESPKTIASSLANDILIIPYIQTNMHGWLRIYPTQQQRSASVLRILNGLHVNLCYRSSFNILFRRIEKF